MPPSILTMALTILLRRAVGALVMRLSSMVTALTLPISPSESMIIEATRSEAPSRALTRASTELE